MKILIISDDEKFARHTVHLLANAVKPRPELVVSSAADGRRNLLAHQPQTVILNADCQQYPDMTDYLVKLMPKYYVPVIVVTSKSNMRYTMVSAGAVDVIVRKPDKESQEYFNRRIVASIESIDKAAAEIKIRTFRESHRLIAIGGSTGSTNALPEILKKLRMDAPPVLCVLHMPEEYTRIYAEQLNSSLDFDVKEAESGMYIKSGEVIIAAGSKHLRVFRDKKGYFITSEKGVKVSGHCPSVDVLFDSVAYAAKSDAIGVILTGMGSDGARGMLTMKKMGAYNIGQDEESCVVYGMPKTAFENGAVSRQCPLSQIADMINCYLDIKK